MERIFLKELEWDSALLGMSCGLIDCSTATDEMDREGIFSRIEKLREKNSHISFITIKLPCQFTSVLNSLIRGDSDLVDTELVFRLDTITPRKISSEVRFVSTYEYDIFTPLAGEMKWSRFFLDSRIPKERARKLWMESIRNHCSGRAHMLAVAIRDGKPVGLITIGLDNENTVKLFIVGVLPEYQQRGVGTDLLRAVSKKFGGSHEVFVETSCNNIAALKLYQKMGFKLHMMRYILHNMR